MNPLSKLMLSLRSWLVIVAPLALWGALWFSLQSGDFSTLSSSTFLRGGSRSLLPLGAALVATVIIWSGVARHRSQSLLFLGPLGLTAIYGLVGVVASFQSPRFSVAIYWSLAYLAVPLVLWGAVWGTDSLSRIQRIINFNWLIISLGVAGLVAVALLYLDLGPRILDPAALSKCQSIGQWQNFTATTLRSTGVGRYAAVAGILAVSLLWRRGWRISGGLILFGSVALLMTSGARTSLAGFGVAAILVTLLYGGKRAVAGGVVAAGLLLPLALVTGFHENLVNYCIYATGAPAAPVKPVVEQQATTPQDAAAGNSQLVTQSPAPISTEAPTSTPGSAEAPTSTPGSAEALTSTPGLAEAPTSTPGLAEAPTSTPGLAEAPTSTPGTAPAQSPTALPPPTSLPAPTEVSTSEQLAAATPRQEEVLAKAPAFAPFPADFFTMSGRTQVWAQGWELFKDSPLLGYGFHADRLVLRRHLHNSYVHALVQTGLFGTLPFIAAILLGWLLLARSLLRLDRLPAVHKHLVIQTAGLMAFLTIRSIPESTGAFFGVDWLLLAPLLLYLQLVNAQESGENRSS